MQVWRENNKLTTWRKLELMASLQLRFSRESGKKNFEGQQAVHGSLRTTQVLARNSHDECHVNIVNNVNVVKSSSEVESNNVAFVNNSFRYSSNCFL